MKVTGKNVVILIKVGLEYKLYACATSATLNVATEVIETSVSGTGKFATFAPTKNSFTGTLEGVTTLEEDSMLSLKDLREKQLNQEVLTILFQRSAGTSTYTDQGDFIITGSSDRIIEGKIMKQEFILRRCMVATLLVSALPVLAQQPLKINGAEKNKKKKKKQEKKIATNYTNSTNV